MAEPGDGDRRDWAGNPAQRHRTLALLGLISTVAALLGGHRGRRRGHRERGPAPLDRTRQLARHPAGAARFRPGGASRGRGHSESPRLVATLLGNNLLVLHRGLVPGGTALIVVTWTS